MANARGLGGATPQSQAPALQAIYGVFCFVFLDVLFYQVAWDSLRAPRGCK